LASFPIQILKLTGTDDLSCRQIKGTRVIKLGYAGAVFPTADIMSQNRTFFQSSFTSNTQKLRGRGFIVPLILAMIVLIALYGVVVWKWSYSTGERVGVVQKISNKGWICKTWEGELNMVVLPGGVPDKFFFTVWDKKVAGDINKTIGRRVSLHYEEKMGLPTSCFGDTRHYVTKVVVLE
jgi:hypothetical protein